MAELKAQFNEARENLSEVVPLEAPFVIYVEISSLCNLECRFCPQHISPKDIVKKNMSIETFKKMIDDINDFKTKPKLIRFCGLGDSLMNKEFVSMVKYASDSRASEKLELITNGALLNDVLIKELPKYLDRIIISIEGLTDSDYMEFTLRKVNFNTLVKKIGQLSAQNGKATIHTKIHNSAVMTEERRQEFFKVFTPIADEVYIENLVDLWPEIKSNLGIEECKSLSTNF